MWMCLIRLWQKQSSKKANLLILSRWHHCVADAFKHDSGDEIDEVMEIYQDYRKIVIQTERRV